MDPRNSGDRSMGGGFAAPRGYAMSGKIMLSAIVVLFTVVLLILFLHLYVRWHLLRLASARRRRRSRRRRGRLFFAEEGHGPAASARGLDPEALRSFPVLVYSSGDEDGEVAAECAVCLNEFEEGEKVRSLPQCGHRFHVECIDMWFHSHATCPLCRSPVEAAQPPPAADEPVQIHAAGMTAAEAGCSSPPDVCFSCRAADLVGSSSSNPRVPELRIDVPARRGLDEEIVVSPGGFKSPGGRIRAIGRLLIRDLRLYRGGGSAEEPDLERGEVVERATPPPTPPPPPSPPPPAPPLGS